MCDDADRCSGAARCHRPGVPTMVKLERICRRYRVGAGVVQALVDVDLEVDPGELVVVLGPSGSGKTTLLNILGALDLATRVGWSRRTLVDSFGEGSSGPTGEGRGRTLKLLSGGSSMALIHQPDVRRRFAPGPSAGPLAVAGVLVVAVVAVIVAIATASVREGPSASSTGGSGVSVTDYRKVAPFARVELAGANTVVIHVGTPLSVAVTGDDNLVGRVTTVVRAVRHQARSQPRI